MMSDASCTSESSIAAVMPTPSVRSMSSSLNIADGRPELTVTKPTRSKSMRKRKSKAVTPAAAVTAVDAAEDDDDEGLLVINPTQPFDLRSLFQRARSTPTMLLPRHSTSKLSGADASRRHLREHEELCLIMPKQSDKGSSSRKAWFMSSGTIGRDNGDSVVVATKDPSMDPVHAEITIHGDDYLLRDLNSSSGTYLCLSTTNRHHPQRDGYRLRAGDTVMLGKGAKLVFTELRTGPKPVADSGSTKKQSLQSKLDRRLTDQLSLEHTARHVLRRQDSKVMTHLPSFTDGRPPKKSVRFSEVLDAGKTDPKMETTLSVDGDTEFPIGSRYRRKTKRPLQPPFPELAPGGLCVVVTIPELPDDSSTIELAPKSCYTIGSSPWCDVQVFSDGIFAVHARVLFDGHFYVLQDLSFEENPRRKTRVLLSRATRIGRGDWLLLGKCALSVANVYRAFRDHEPDLKEAAFKCQLLRPSKRKSRRREKYLPVAFKHAQADTFVIGKGGMCDGQVYTATLSYEQFVLQVDHGQCSLTPRFAGVNQGMYFLLGRNSILHEPRYKDDVIRYTSKALMLVEGSVFKVGSSELEVVFVKVEDTGEVVARNEEIKENTRILKEMPWLQQISFSRHSMENVARRAQRLFLEPGDSVYDEGDPASFLFVVISGEIELTSTHKLTQRSPTLTRQGSGGSAIGLSTATGEKEALVEVVYTGSYFGEVSLWAAEMDYAETAKALTECQLLVLSREDVCGYFGYYMDIIRPHLCYEAHKDLLQKLRLCVPFCSTLSYQELRVMAAKGERVYYQQDEMILQDGAFTYKGKTRLGLLLLRYGAVDIVGSNGESLSMAEVPGEADGKLLEDDAPPTPLQAPAWSMDEPMLMLPHTLPTHVNLKARAGVQCFFIDLSAFKHLLKEHEDRIGTGFGTTFKKTLSGSIIPPPVMRRRSTNRRSSYATQFKVRHSQVFTTALRDNNGVDDADNLIENADLEDANDPSRKWRRKKRNRNLLEKIIVETQQNPDLLNALVLYVLSGANRGDIHVVRNVANIGGLISGADIELNDQCVSQQQAVIEHREGRYWLYDTFSEWGTYVRLEENQTVQIYPGDVFLAGEVEFTCMGAFPERKKSSLCSIM